jgi:hypothetical protein
MRSVNKKIVHGGSPSAAIASGVNSISVVGITMNRMLNTATEPHALRNIATHGLRNRPFTNAEVSGIEGGSQQSEPYSRNARDTEAERR